MALEVDRTHGLRLLHGMLRIRRFEEKCAELYQAGRIRGFMHLCDGEEAVAVGVMEALERDDAVVSTYREHGHALARGLAMGACMAELFGKQEGCARGRGGSMHFFDAGTRLYGGNAIVGGGLPLALGLALADRMRDLPRVTACLFGDGAVAEGVFHESLNLAALWKLPVLLLCENNQYAMGTALRYSHSMQDLAAKGAAYGVPARAVDGMDVLAVEEATREAAARVRSGQGPYFMEFRTYRFRPHSMFDAELYRTRGEIEEWRARCPLRGLEARLEQAGLLTPADLEALEREVAGEIEEAVAFAEAGAWEPVEDLERFVVTRP